MENIYFSVLLKLLYAFNNEYFLLLVFINDKREACIV